MTSGSHEGRAIVVFLYKMNSLVRSSAVWKIMIVNKAFCTSTDGSFDRSIMYRKDESMKKVAQCIQLGIIVNSEPISNRPCNVWWFSLPPRYSYPSKKQWLPLRKDGRKDDSKTLKYISKIILVKDLTFPSFQGFWVYKVTQVWKLFDSWNSVIRYHKWRRYSENLCQLHGPSILTHLWLCRYLLLRWSICTPAGRDIQGSVQVQANLEC